MIIIKAVTFYFWKDSYQKSPILIIMIIKIPWWEKLIMVIKTEKLEILALI